MLLYLSPSNLVPHQKTLNDTSHNTIYTLTTSTLWSPSDTSFSAVPAIKQTEIANATGDVMARVDYDGPIPVYVDFGEGDERVPGDLLTVRDIGPRYITLQSLSNTSFLWTLTPTSMTLTSPPSSGSTPVTIASFHPNSRVSPTGTFEQRSASKSSSSKRKADERDWLEIGLIPSDLPIAELLVEFLVLNNLRQIYFLLPPEAPAPPISPTQSLTNSNGDSLQKRIRQAVF